jgi:hypothetical protein
MEDVPPEEGRMRRLAISFVGQHPADEVILSILQALPFLDKLELDKIVTAILKTDPRY